MIGNNLHPAEYIQTPLDIKVLEPYCLARIILFIASRVYARYIWHSPQSQAAPLTPFDKSDLTLAEAAYCFDSLFLPARSPVTTASPLFVNISASSPHSFTTGLEQYFVRLLPHSPALGLVLSGLMRIALPLFRLLRSYQIAPIWTASQR